MRRNRSDGFTLVEMIAALTVLALLAAIAGPYMVNGVRAYNDSASAVHTLSKLRLASERLVREIRETRRNAGSGNYDILSPIANPSGALRFVKTDGEPVTIGNTATLLTLAYDSINVATPYTLSDELNSIVFNFWQSDGTAATNNSDVAFVEFELVLTHAGNNYAQRSRVALRNRP